MKRAFLLTGSMGIAILAMNLVVRSQTAPGPKTDRVGYPEGYQTSYRLLYAFDRPDNKQVRVVYGNDQAASVKAGEPFPYGSIVVMETWNAKRDSEGNALLDSQGRFQRDQLTAVFVARKELGFGAEYEINRGGEWEYVAYRPDKSYQTAPQNSASCAICHLQAGATRDWQFRPNLVAKLGTGAVPNKTIQHYLFLPGVIRVSPGTTVSWYNDDEVAHTVRAANGSWESKLMPQGASFNLTFNERGRYDYICGIHRQMRGTVIVDLPTLKIGNTANLNRNPGFWTGDRWRLEVTGGPPLAPVYLQIWKDGKDQGVSGPYGSTDAYGSLILTGSFSASDIASWQIQAITGSRESTDRSQGPISFTVSKSLF